jgi:hypothetical protein
MPSAQHDGDSDPFHNTRFSRHLVRPSSQLRSYAHLLCPISSDQTSPIRSLRFGGRLASMVDTMAPKIPKGKEVKKHEAYQPAIAEA